MNDEQHKAARPAQTTNWSRPDYTDESDGIAVMKSDDAIAQEVEYALTEESQLDFSDAKILVSEGEVTLEGYVAKLSDKTYAGELVSDIDSVRNVHNNLRIAPERH